MTNTTNHTILLTSPGSELRGFLVPASCLDGRSCGYRRGLVGSGGLRRAALSHQGCGFTPGLDARHGPPRGRMPAASPLACWCTAAGLRRLVDVLTMQPACVSCLQVQPIDPIGLGSDVQSEVGRKQVSILSYPAVAAVDPL